MLAVLVNDKEKDHLALEVFALIFYNKLICPTYSIVIKREATMVEDFDLRKLKTTDLCQLLVDELKRAIFAWQASNAKWKALPGCVILPLLMYLDCVYHRSVKDVDKRTPRILYMDENVLTKLADLDLVQKGNHNPETWIYGKLPVSHKYVKLLYLSRSFKFLRVFIFSCLFYTHLFALFSAVEVPQ